MFTKKISVIHIFKNKLKVASVSLGKTPKILKADETGWNQESLTQTFQQASRQLKTTKIRLLLSKELSYTFNIKIPLDTKPNKERQIVLEKLQAVVPETLDDSNWDFKETGKKDQTHKEIIVFAPAKDKFEIINQALSQAKLTVEAIEPEIVAKIRNQNPIIGIALKKDLEGKDESVLNFIPKILKKSSPSINQSSSENHQPSSQAQTDPPPPQSKSIINKKFLIIFSITFSLSALIAGGILTSRKALNKKTLPSPTPFIIASPIPSTEASPSATPEPKIVLSNYKLLVLNGTGGKGVAGAVKDILEAEGFESIKANNADKFDFTTTQIQLKKTTSNKVFEIINKALNSAYEVTHSAEILTEDTDYDVIITVGKTINTKE